MSTIDWGAGFVHPADGLDTANGRGMDTPKRTVSSALSAGFDFLNLGPGDHNVSRVDGLVTLRFYPGTHNLLNAPVLSNKIFSGISSMRRSPSLDGAGGARITSPGNVNAFFAYDGTEDEYGGLWAGLWYDLTKINALRGALDFRNWNCGTVEDNIGYRPTYGNRYTVYANPNIGIDNSWNRFTRNVNYNSGLYHSIPPRAVTNRFAWIDNINVAPGGDATDPFIYIDHDRQQGMLFDGQTFDGLASGAAALHLGRGHLYEVIGTHVANIANSGNVWLYLAEDTDTGSSYIQHLRGVDAEGGRVRLNTPAGDYYPPDGADTYYSARDIRFDIAAARNNL